MKFNLKPIGLINRGLSSGAWLKVLNRSVLLLIVLLTFCYFLSAMVSWRYDGDRAKRYTTLIRAYSYKGLNVKLGEVSAKVKPDALYKLDSVLRTRLDSQKIQPVNLGLMAVFDQQGETFDFTLPKNVSIPIDSLEGLSYWSRDRMAMVAEKTIPQYYAMNMDQFIVRGAFAANKQFNILLVIMGAALVFIIVNGVSYYNVLAHQREQQAKQDVLRDKLNNGGEASPVWELAQITLNKYYERNLNQNKLIFYVSVSVMIAGFCLIVYGITLVYHTGDDKTAALVSSVSGIIVQFIGATFLVIYNSTIAQSVRYTASLQQVSTIGTSIKILENIKTGETEEMKNDHEFNKSILTAQIDIAKSLIEQSKIRE